MQFTPAHYRRLVLGYLGRSGTWLVWVMAGLVAAYVGGLVMHGGGSDPLVDGWLAVLAKASLVAVGWAAVVRAGPGRVDLLLAAAGVTMIAATDVWGLLAVAAGAPRPGPEPVNAGHLAFYTLMAVVLYRLARRNLRGMAPTVLLDSAVGVLGAASVLAVLLSPVLTSLETATPARANAAALAYPWFNLLLVAALSVIAASQGPVARRRWILLVLGLMIFASTDIVFTLIGGGDATDTPLSAGWTVGLALAAVWMDSSARPELVLSRTVTGVTALAIPVVATFSGLGVLLLASQVPLAPLAVGLAAATMALAAVPLLSRQVELRRRSRTDDLTGLPNRRALYASVFARLSGAGSRPHALLLLDLDRFKEVNDSLGHDAGDRLLVQISTRLSTAVRSGDLLARLGGDEFAILLGGCGRPEAEAVAIQLRAALALPFTLEGITLQTSVSIGIALYPDQGEDLTGLLRMADMAMYKAKSTHSGHHVYALADNSHGDARLRTVQELRVALHDEQLVLHYQPKITLATGEVHGVEALVRWNHPTRGLLYPDMFLALIEETGLMLPLTEVVLRQSLDQAAAWTAAGRPLTVAVNLSASSLIDIGLPQRIGAMIASRGLPSSVLTLEITEEFLMADRVRARDILARLRASGVRISVDDFGTGYSSLAYLRDLPIDELKLDQSFVFPMADDARAAALVASTIDLAHSLGLRMVAEGVEDVVAYDELTRFGCDYAQGYVISRPVPAGELDDWLMNRRSEAARS